MFFTLKLLGAVVMAALTLTSPAATASEINVSVKEYSDTRNGVTFTVTEKVTVGEVKDTLYRVTQKSVWVPIRQNPQKKEKIVYTEVTTSDLASGVTFIGIDKDDDKIVDSVKACKLADAVQHCDAYFYLSDGYHSRWKRYGGTKWEYFSLKWTPRIKNPKNIAGTLQYALRTLDKEEALVAQAN